MIIGDPYVFSIIIDIVDEWNNDKSFNNGLLFMGINGKLIPHRIVTSTLNTEVFHLLGKLKNPMENREIYQMEKREAFICIYEKTFPDDYDMESDDCYDITPFEFASNNYFVFMVSNGKENRILASKMQYMIEESTHNLEELDVIETYISKDELEVIIDQLDVFRQQSQVNES